MVDVYLKRKKHEYNLATSPYHEGGDEVVGIRMSMFDKVIGRELVTVYVPKEEIDKMHKQLHGGK